jgi:adhesin/invasin
MTIRRRRLSVEGLEDRTTPASASDLQAVAQQTISTAFVLQWLSNDPMAVANPAIRPAVESYFTAVYQNAVLTTQLLGQFPGTLPAGQEAMVGAMAANEAGIAQFVSARLGFNLTPPATGSTPSTPTNPTPGTISAAKSTIGVNPASVPVGSTSTITLTAKDANGIALTTGGAQVAFAFGSATVIGSIGSVHDNNNGTYTATFTASAAGSNTITATINGQNVTTTAPPLTVTAASSGTADLAESSVTLSSNSVAVNGTSTATLTARDANGTALTTGGLSVGFSLGTGTNIGSFGQVTDNHDGTYTATFTGSTAGSNTVVATIGGQTVTSPHPTMTVTAAAGPVDATKSTVVASPTSITTSQTSTVTLTAKDANGTALTTGGAAVVFALDPSATATGSFSTPTDNGDGTYTSTFTPTAAGSAPITATIGGQAVTTTLPTITVTAASGTASLSNSRVTVNPTLIGPTGTATVTLTARDDNNVQLTTGGLDVAFGLGSGSVTGNFSSVVDHNDGTYTATFTPTASGSNTITATIGGQPVTFTAPSITVT